MKQIKLLLALLLLAGFTANAQAPGPKHRFDWRQIPIGAPGNVAIVGVDSIGAWVTPPFAKYSDTAAMLAAYGAGINARVKYSDTAAMLSAYRTAIQNRVSFTDTAAMLSAYRAAISALQTGKADDNTVVHNTGNETVAGIKTFSSSPVIPTPTAGDNSTKAASTAFVTNAITTNNGNYVPTSALGVSVATLVGGKLPSSQVPPLAITETYVVNSVTAMLALSNAEQGDVAIRTDSSRSFILGTGSYASYTNWREIQTPFDGVQSVNGKSGANVSLTTDDVPEGSTNKYYTDARVGQAISAGSGIGFNQTTRIITNTAPNVQSNLALGTRTSTTVPITNSDGTGVTVPVVTTSLAGAMSAADKAKLDGIATGATSNTGTVTSIGVSVPTGLSVTGSPVTTSGTIAITNAAGYAIPTTAKQLQWDTAFLKQVVTATVTGTTTKTLTITLKDGSTVFTNWSDLQDAYSDDAFSITNSTASSFTFPFTPSPAKHLIIDLNGQIINDITVSGSTATIPAYLGLKLSDVISVRYSYHN
jgi:hypothetical protein